MAEEQWEKKIYPVLEINKSTGKFEFSMGKKAWIY